MTFGDFVRNYLNPIFLFYRVSLLGFSFAAFLIAFTAYIAVPLKLAVGALGLWLAWVAVKPWGSGHGLSLRDMQRRAEDATRRL